MYRRSLSLLFRSLVSLVAVGYLVIHPGVSPAVAAQLTSQQVSQFLADPSALLNANPARMSSQIRDLMLSDTCIPAPASPVPPTCEQVLTAVIGLLAKANDAQKRAIGTALADAAHALITAPDPTRVNPTLANEIQTMLAANGDKLAVEAYQTTVGDQAIGAGGGGGAGAAAYQTLTNTGGGGGGGLATGPTATGTSGIGLTGSGSVSNGSNGSNVAAAVSAQ
jgi:hypothetical protein